MNMVPRINGVRETARRILKNRVAFCVIFLCIMIVFVPVSPSGAEEYLSEDWQVSVTPYLWGVSLKGDVTVKGKTAEVDLSFSDILEDLDMALLFEAEARKNRVLHHCSGYARIAPYNNFASVHVCSECSAEARKQLRGKRLSDNTPNPGYAYHKGIHALTFFQRHIKTSEFLSKR